MIFSFHLQLPLTPKTWGSKKWSCTTSIHFLAELPVFIHINIKKEKIFQIKTSQVLCHPFFFLFFLFFKFQPQFFGDCLQIRLKVLIYWIRLNNKECCALLRYGTRWLSKSHVALEKMFLGWCFTFGTCRCRDISQLWSLEVQDFIELWYQITVINVPRQCPKKNFRGKKRKPKKNRQLQM